MDARPDAPHLPEPLGGRPGAADLGPISPELALVDPELARRARELLPEPRELPRRPLPPPGPAAPQPKAEPEPEPSVEPEVRRRRRWPQTLALAIVIFVAGAASGTLLGNHQTGSPATTLEVRAAAPTSNPTATTRAALRPPSVAHTKTTRSTTAKRSTKPARSTAPPRQRRRHARITWAANVLGVEATVNGHVVALAWKRPADSAHVVVLRKREARANSVVVYRGRATSYRDASPSPCAGYQYTIVNYDRSGHRSTGVPTAVVTRCA